MGKNNKKMIKKEKERININLNIYKYGNDKNRKICRG